MPDREKVIGEFEDFVKSFSKRDDTYYKGLFVSVLALLKEQEHKDRMFHALEEDWKKLKEQEAVKPKSKVRHGENVQYQHFCGNCMVMLHGKPKYCSNCGMKVKWK